jgi:hypothetical protein
VIPVILRPVDWHGAGFGKLHALPRNGKAVTTWRDRDQAFFDVARGIREVLRPEAKEVPGEMRSKLRIFGEDVQPPPIRRLLRALKRALAGGDLQDSELGPDVLATLQDEREVKLAKAFDPLWMIAAIGVADSYFTRIRLSAGQRAWQRDFPKAATPVLVGMAWSLERSADAQAIVLRLCEVITKRLRLRLSWPANADKANDLKNAIYSKCLDASVLECDDVLVLLRRLKVTGPE